MKQNGLTVQQLKSLSAGDVVLVNFRKARRQNVPCMLLPYQHPDYLNLAVPSPDGTKAGTREMPYASLGADWTAISRIGAE